MPQTLFRENYYYELFSHSLSVYKYDVFDQRYIKIDQCFLQRLPKKYLEVLEAFQQNQLTSPTQDLENLLQNIKITV